mgnify:CR=1 FL=1
MRDRLSGLKRGVLLAAVLASSLLQSPVTGQAAESATHASPTVQARLISAEDGIAPDASSLSMALDIALGDGWKTYWRSPGEVGIPPQIDWTGSQNIADVEMLWPAPKRFRAFGIENFGYDTEVAFPLRVALEQPGAPARLNAAVNLLVCSDICVPEIFDLTLTLDPGTGIDLASAARIAEYAAKVPDDGERSGISISTASIAADLTATRHGRHLEAGQAALRMPVDARS